MDVRKSPCYKCEFRTVGCHSKCEPYLTWKSFVNERAEKIAKERYIPNSRINWKHRAKCGVYSTKKK